MIRTLPLLPVFGLVLGTPALLAAGGDAGAASIPAGDRIVVLISLDGLPGEALEDPHAPAPNLRRLAAEGAVARGMRPSNPTVTWPNHTTFVTGVSAARHGVLFNGLLVREGAGRPVRIEPWRDKREMVRVPTVYDVAHGAGLTTAEVDWVAIQNPGTITWAFSERPDPQGQIARELVGRGVLTDDEAAGFSKGNIVWRDSVWTTAAAHIIESHRPNLLLFHLLALDSTQHQYGPDGLAARVAIGWVDAQLGRIVEALSAAGLEDRATIFVVSDHGFKTVTRSVRPNVILRRAGLLTVHGETVQAEAHAVSQGGTAMVFVTDSGRREKVLPRLRELFQGAEGIARIVEPAEYAGLGLPPPDTNDQMGDLVLAAADGYAFSGGHDGDPVFEVSGGVSGAHGYPNTDPEMTAFFLAWGYGIRKGGRLDVVDNRDVAPTIAALLGITMEDVEGKPLSVLEEAMVSQ